MEDSRPRRRVVPIEIDQEQQLEDGEQRQEDGEQQQMEDGEQQQKDGEQQQMEDGEQQQIEDGEQQQVVEQPHEPEAELPQDQVSFEQFLHLPTFIHILRIRHLILTQAKSSFLLLPTFSYFGMLCDGME